VQLPHGLCTLRCPATAVLSRAMTSASFPLRQPSGTTKTGCVSKHALTIESRQNHHQSSSSFEPSLVRGRSTTSLTTTASSYGEERSQLIGQDSHTESQQMNGVL